MFTEITEDTISATDSCQMETTGTTLKVSPATQPTNQVTSENLHCHSSTNVPSMNKSHSFFLLSVLPYSIL